MGMSLISMVAGLLAFGLAGCGGAGDAGDLGGGSDALVQVVDAGPDVEPLDGGVSLPWDGGVFEGGILDGGFTTLSDSGFGSDVAPGAGNDEPGDVGGGDDVGPGDGGIPDDGNGSAAPLTPNWLPQVHDTCPSLVSGDVTFTAPGIGARQVRIWVEPGVELTDSYGPDGDGAGGALVFYWHGTGSSPDEALYGLGQEVIGQITGNGGLVAAPYGDNAAGVFPWFLTDSVGAEGRLDDLLVADQVVACALEQLPVDVRRIHSVGMSAGGLQTAQMGFRRSSYLASVALYSGGVIHKNSLPPNQYRANLLPALIFHGGPSDRVIISFQAASINYWDVLREEGHLAIICDHGDGHVIPADARGSVLDFFSAHPYGTVPSPYQEGLPPYYPPYCSLEP